MTTSCMPASFRHLEPRSVVRIAVGCGLLAFVMACTQSFQCIECKVDDIDEFRGSVIVVAKMQGHVSTNSPGPDSYSSQELSVLLEKSLPDIAGVTFNHGASIVIDSSNRVVRMRNTRENCMRLSELLAGLHIEQAKRMEILEALDLAESGETSTNKFPK